MFPLFLGAQNEVVTVVPGQSCVGFWLDKTKVGLRVMFMTYRGHTEEPKARNKQISSFPSPKQCKTLFQN